MGSEMCIRDRSQSDGYIFVVDGAAAVAHDVAPLAKARKGQANSCLLYTSDAADERSSVDLGGRRIIKKKNTGEHMVEDGNDTNNKQRRTW